MSKNNGDESTTDLDVEELEGGAEETKCVNNLDWTLEDNKFKVSWSLPKGSTSAKDYISLCIAGMF